VVTVGRVVDGTAVPALDVRDALPWWVRAYLLLGAAQGLVLGITGLIAPPELQIPLRVTPLNARFVAALYTAAALGLVLSALVRHRRDAQIFVVGFGVATTLIAIVTVLHWSEFMDPSLPHRPLWLTAYVVDPILAFVIVPTAGFWRFPSTRDRRLRLAPLAVGSLVLAVAGLVLVLLPQVAVALWPWTLSPVLSQVYGSFFLAFAAGGVLALREARPVMVRNLATVLLVMAALVLAVSLIHLDRFKPGAVTWVWLAVFAVGALISGLGLFRLLAGSRDVASVPSAPAS
jgi:hypothetical protein